MADFRFELNHAGIRELLNSPGVVAELRRRAERVASAAGPGHEVTTTTGARARATVRAVTHQARAAEARDRKLTRAIDAAR